MYEQVELKKIQTMEEFVCQIIILSLFVVFVLILADKWGIRTLMQIKGPEIVSKMARCTFCMGFWTGVCLGVIATVVTGDWFWTVAAVPAAAFSWRIME